MGLFLIVGMRRERRRAELFKSVLLIVLLIVSFLPSFGLIHAAHASSTGFSDNLYADSSAKTADFMQLSMSTASAGSASIVSIGPMSEGFVDVLVVFQVRNTENLKSFVNNAHAQTKGKPESLTEEQFEVNYAPAAVDYEKAISFIEAHNMTVTQTWANKLLLAARGSVNDVENTFNTEIGLFRYQNVTFYKSLREVKVSPLMKGLGVAGVEINSFPAEPDLERFSSADPGAIATHRSPNDLRNVYGTSNLIQDGWTGTGETIGIVDAYGDSAINNDVASFDNYYSLPSLALTISGTGGTPPSGSNWEYETALDVEWAHAMAPGAAISLQLSPDASTRSLFGAVNTLVSLTNPPNVISLSWSGSSILDTFTATLYSGIFSAAASKGIKVYASTGDDGAYNGGSSLSVNYPACDPNVIAVGGTSLYYNTVQSTDEYYEYGWNGSGGGYSSVYGEPAYQSNAGIPDPNRERAIPDVSLEAYPGVSIYEGGSLSSSWGGTSLSAPLMAGISAVALNGGWNLDNNAFYNLYSSNAKYNVGFHDVYLSGNNGYYNVQSGWDAVTGLGSINLYNFIRTFNFSQSGAVTLTGESLSPSSITAGQSFTLSYTINNPASYDLTQIGLGASIRLHGSTNMTSDPSNDIYISLPGGVSTQSRQFLTTSSLTPGWYDVMWGVWMGPPGQGNSLSHTDWQSSQLQVVAYTLHYVAATNVTPSKTVIGQGYSAKINVTVANQGNYTENFKVTVYANATSIASKNITLSIGNSATTTFVWNTTGLARGSYTIKVQVALAPNETNTANNTFVYGIVKVTIPGDVNGDGKVTWDDLSDLGLAYGSKPGDPNWNPNADINGDGKVAWDDLSTLGLNYGKSW
jgi:hypothetical protein